MSYKGVDYKSAVGAYVATDVIVEKISVRNGDINKPITVFVKLSAGALTSLELYESIDGSDWLNATALAAYQGSTLWATLTLKGSTYPTGTLLQLRCVTAGVYGLAGRSSDEPLAVAPRSGVRNSSVAAV